MRLARCGFNARDGPRFPLTRRHGVSKYLLIHVGRRSDPLARPSPARAAESPDRRGELVRHALELARKSGLAGLTMKKVARRVGFTEAAAYRYFPNKRALVVAMFEHAIGGFFARARLIATDAAASREERLERIVRLHIGLVLETEGLPILILAEAASTGDRALLGRIRDGVDAYLGLLESLLPPQPDGAPGPSARARALLLFGMPAVLAIRRRLGSSRDAEREVPDALLPFVVRQLTGTSPTRPKVRKRGAS